MNRTSGLAQWLLLAGALGGCVNSSNPSAPDGGGPPLVDAAPGPDASGEDSAPPPPSVTLGVASTVDFGMAPCGGSAPAPQTFSIANTGASPVHYALALSATTAFQIVGATSGDVAPGASAQGSIAMTAEPTSATAGAVDQATLTITTDDPNHPSTAVTLTRTAQGATLTLSPATAALLDTPLTSTSQPLPLTLTNTGNLAASLTLAAPTDPQFALTWTGASSAPVTLAPNASLPGLSATFSPTTAGAATASSALNVTTPVCGPSVASIPFTGNGTKGQAVVSPGTLAFGSVNCGAKAAAQTVTVKNTGTAPFTYTAALLLGASSPFKVSPATGSVAPGASATVTATPSAIPAVASITTNAFGDTLRITTNAVGDANHDVALTQTAQGAVLALDSTTLPFNDVTLLQPSSLPFTLHNTGTLPATVTLTTTAPFTVTPTAATALTVGGSPLSGSAIYTPTALGPATGSVTVATGASVLCSAPLGPIHLTGTGVNGTMSLSTATLDFKSVPCGQTTGAQSFTITNTGTAPFSWTAALGKTPSPYVVSPTSGTQAPGAAATTITVTPAAIPFPSALTANLYGDTLTITPTGISGGKAQTVALTETAEGAIVTVTPSPLPSFGNQQEGQASAPATLTIKNTGTLPVSITPAIVGGDSGSFALTNPGPTTLAANGGSYSPGPTFVPSTGGLLLAQVALSSGTGDVLCQPLPAPTALSGTGTNGQIAVGSGSVSFAAQTCGATAGLTAPVLLTNNGTAPVTFNASILGGTGFKVSPATGALAANGGSTSLTVTGPTFGTSLGNVNAVTDTLRVTTNAYQDTNHDVPLSSTPSGAIVVWDTGALAFGTTQATSNGSVSTGLGFSLQNNGNVAATVSFATAGGGPYTFAPQNSTLAAGGTPLNGTATFTPTTSGTQSDTLEVNVAGGTPLCAPLPAGLGLSGTGAQGAFSSDLTGLDFSLTCNAAAAAQTFTLTNEGGSEPYDFTASIGAGWSVSPASGTVAVNSVASITVTPPTQGDGTPGATNDVNVTVFTDIPGDPAHVYAVNGTVTGATLAFVDGNHAAQPTLTMNGAIDGVTATTYLANTGNASAPLDYVISPADGILTLSWSGTAATGYNAITYTIPARECGLNQTYTVTFPNKSVDGVCSAAVTQTVTARIGC